ncbi:VanZ family protein [Actinomadura parmotrematis]|uniref:VanZ family protein n=1 Tax=Actinomadura parmotrematis TaxID=2864039 RepID=A0ABS7FMB4_9ACTN|nr:VanZ family protein [Actinomadura parmotrematis]MBW8481140.1 VanZ family protein [Actinomadura parmotrematis]
MDQSAPPPARRTYKIVVAVLAVAAVAAAVLGPGRTALRMVAMPLHRPGDPYVWFNTFNGIALLTLLALPLALLAAWVLARRRRAAGAASAWRVSLAEVGIVYGTVPWVWMIMLPGDEDRAVVNLVPLRDLATMDAGQVIGNLLVFAALGFFTPLRFAAPASLPRVLALGAACSALLEVAQYVLRLDRVSSVDDVLVNAAGAGLAALVSRPWWRTADGSPRPAPERESEAKAAR